MKHKVKKIHFVGIGLTVASSEQGPAHRAGCERPRETSAADDTYQEMHA
jgi:hypothetical protein